MACRRSRRRRGFEDELSAAVSAHGTLVAHETFNRLRVLHFYVDSQTNARAELESRLPHLREGRASTDVRRDPSFEQVRHLMQYRGRCGSVLADSPPAALAGTPATTPHDGQHEP
jgi:hypothetical protein